VKIKENIQAEIMQVLLDEARESYAKDIVAECQSESIKQLEQNVEKISAYVARVWKSIATEVKK